MPISNFFNQVTRKAGQVWGQADRALGGVLPGGSDNAYLGASKPYFKRPSINEVAQKMGANFYASQLSSPFERDLGKVIDVGASAIAGARPYVKTAINQSPDIVKDLTSSVLNQLPVSANLFGRYYTGIGAEGLELPKSFIEGSRPAIQSSAKNINQYKNDAARERSGLEADIKLNRQGEKTFMDYSSLNNRLAEVKSFQNKLNQGYVPVETAMSMNEKDPMSALGTSLGRAFFQPSGDGGWKTNEKYDFEYGGADKRQDVQPREALSPSKDFAQVAASRLLDKFSKTKAPEFASASGSPAALFGRAIVAKMEPDSFKYNILIPPK